MDDALSRAFKCRTFDRTNVELLLGAGDQARSLFLYLESIGATAIVEEFGYVDLDYLEDYSHFYSRCFQPYAKRCSRLHFFNITPNLDEKTLLEYVENLRKPDDLQRAYLGFVVVRPLRNAPIGRTAIRSRDNHSICNRTHTANLFGIPLFVESVAYQQQDNAIAACATIAVWSSLNKASVAFNRALPSPAEITMNAHRHGSDGRSIPSKGLDMQQICAAITAAGLDPEKFEGIPGSPLLSMITGYLHLGVPVILGAAIGDQGHALAITGYRRRSSPADFECWNLQLPPLSGRFVQTLYAHDDAKGPFSSLEILPRNDSARGFPFAMKSPKWENLLKPKVISIPVPARIRISYLDVLEWVNRIHEVVEFLEPSPLRSQPLKKKTTRLNWDIALTTTNRLKEDLRKGRGSHYPLQSAKRLLLATHPEYIWRVRLEVDNQTVMELYADATEAPRTFPFYDLAVIDPKYASRLFALLTGKLDHDIFRRTLKPPTYDFLTKHPGLMSPFASGLR